MTLLLAGSPRFARSLLHDSLHLLTRESFEIATALGISTLLETLLAAMAILLVFLLALIGPSPVFPRGLATNLLLDSNIE